MLAHDPIPWLSKQEGLRAVRVRRSLGLCVDGDDAFVSQFRHELERDQGEDGAFAGSVMKTSGVLNVLNDLGIGRHNSEVVARAACFLLAVLRRQPGCGKTQGLQPGTHRIACDLCGFFGPFDERTRPERREEGARELNLFREVEPLFAPRSPVRVNPRSSLDRAGPKACYAWGFVPLCTVAGALSRAGYAGEPAVAEAYRVIQAVQRDSGGWCRNLGGHPECTVHALRALTVHPDLKSASCTERAFAFMMERRRRPTYALLQIGARSELSTARELIHELIGEVAPRQRRNGTFGSPCPIERVGAVLAAVRQLAGPGAE